jgi:hypothetical protein
VTQPIPRQPETPRDLVVREAIGLAFAVAGALILFAMQKRLLDGVGGTQSGQRMQAALAEESRWHKATVWLWRYGPFKAAQAAGAKADAARTAYEQERW